MTRLLWSLVGAAYLAQVVTILRATPAWLVTVLPDDAFYYLEIGRRLGRGEGPTFDGLNQTNGFHPLWQAAVTPLTWLFQDWVLVKAVMIAGLLAGLTGIVLVARLLRPLVGGTAAAFGALVVVHGTGAMAWQRNGMESSMVVLTLALLATALCRFDRDRTGWSAVAVGLASGAVVLARIDFGVLMALMPVVLALRVRGRWPIVPWLAGGGALVAPVAGASYLHFHHVLTVSGTIKLHWMSTMADERFGGRMTSGYLALVSDHTIGYLRALADDVGTSALGRSAGVTGTLSATVLLVPALCGSIWWWRRRVGAPPTGARVLSANAWALTVVGAVVVAKTAMDLFLLPDWATSWYSAPGRVLAGFAIGIGAWSALRHLAASHTRLIVAVAAGLLVAATLPTASWEPASTTSTQAANWQQSLSDAADWVIAEGPVGTYGAYDAGLLGYRLDGTAPLVNLDGLVNDYDYANLVMQDSSTLAELDDQHVDVLVNRVNDDELDVLDCATLLWQAPDTITYNGVPSRIRVLDVRACHGLGR